MLWNVWKKSNYKILKIQPIAIMYNLPCSKSDFGVPKSQHPKIEATDGEKAKELQMCKGMRIIFFFRYCGNFHSFTLSLVHIFYQCLKPVVDYLLSLLEHLISRIPALPRWVCMVAERACLPQHPSCVWGWERRKGGEPDKLGGERLRPRQPPRCSWRDGEELTERCSEE